MLSTAELLTKALETLFRRKTVNVAAFANSDGPVSHIPMGYFSSDRLKKHAEKPIDVFAAARVMLMARAALSGDSYYDASTVSSRMSRIIVNSFGVETRNIVLVGTSDYDYEFKMALRSRSCSASWAWPSAGSPLSRSSSATSTAKS